MSASNSTKPEVGDILVVIHDFQARSSDELTLAKGDRVELLERDDEFGDGWYLGKHVVNGNSGLFPEVYTRPAPKPAANVAVFSSPKQPLTPLAEAAREQTTAAAPPTAESHAEPIATTAPAAETKTTPAFTLGSFKSTSATASPAPSASSVPANIGSGMGATRPGTNTDSHVLHETLNVINEHITDFNSPAGNASVRNGNDSGSEYSSHMGHRISYIQGEETDEEEETVHTREEVESWNADQVAEYLFTVGVEKHHCEVFRDQEITGEVLLGMDQTSVFIKALDLGSVGRRLKTWQKIKQLQDEVAGLAMSTGRLTQNYGSEAGSDAGRVRSRTSTLTSSGPRFAPLHEFSATGRRTSQTPRHEPYEPVSPVSPLAESPTRKFHDKRPSAASVRDLHHSRRHSSTDFRISGAVAHPPGPPKTSASSAFLRQDGSHKKQPSFDRNWTLGGATALVQRPLSSAGHPDGATGQAPERPDPAADIDRGYFSGTDAESRRRNVLKKRDSVQASPKASYTEEQRVRSGTALSRHSRLGSLESVRDSALSPAAQKYYGVSKRTPSVATTDSLRLVSGPKEAMNPTVTRLDSNSSDHSRSSPKSSIKRLSQVNHPDFNVTTMLRSGLGGLRAASDAVTGSERAKLSPIDSPLKESPAYSPARTGSSTPSGGPSFDLDSPETTKSPSTATTATSRTSRKKTKQETSAYTRGLQKITPSEAMKDADFSGWMKKRSANLMTTWKPRLFVLKGRRLAYYYSEDDDQERGLIDISFHRVLPADNERLTGLHATLTGVSSSPAMPVGSQMTTSAAADAERDPDKDSDSIFIFKLVPPRAGLSRAVNFTKPTVHYFAVPNIKHGRLWMAALMKATIDRDDTQPITSSYQQKTISLAKARQMRHRPPALMNLDEGNDDAAAKEKRAAATGRGGQDSNGLGIVYSEVDSAVAGLEKFGLQHPESARAQGSGFGLGADKDTSLLPQSA